MSNFVLVAGACHSAWCWRELVPLLEAAGHRVWTPDLLGMGADETPLTSITLDIWARQIADLVQSIGEPVILVGHSRGGVVISQAAELIPERISYLVYVAALLLPDGGTVADIYDGLPLTAASPTFEVRADGIGRVNPETATGRFYHKTPRELADWAISMLCLEPLVVLRTPLQLTEERYGTVRRAYVECTEDQALPLDQQRRLQKRLPCDPVFTLPTDHSPFFSAPAELTAALHAVASTPAAS